LGVGEAQNLHFPPTAAIHIALASRAAIELHIYGGMGNEPALKLLKGAPLPQGNGLSAERQLCGVVAAK
jgi:hypothetical protein